MPAARRWLTWTSTSATPPGAFTSEELQDFYPEFWAQDTLTLTLTSQGPVTKRLGLPFFRSLFFIIYNQTWAGEMGFAEPPDTPFNLRTQACVAAQAGTQPGVGGWLVTDSGSLDDQLADPPSALLLSWIAAYGGQISRPDGTGYQFNTPQVERALGFIKGLQDSGCAWLGRDLDPAAEFAARRALLYAASLTDLPAQRRHDRRRQPRPLDRPAIPLRQWQPGRGRLRPGPGHHPLHA
jgi:ABC-type glycerol-3-phosphate transport system substrate-binding protein